VPVEFSHKELSLLVFALEGANHSSASQSSANMSSDGPSCEESCPVVEDLEDLFGEGGLSHEKKLARHLNNHLREALVECGMFELLALGPVAALTDEQLLRLQRANRQLGSWSCEIELVGDDRQLLREAITRLPGSAWATMPRTLWRLRKKLRKS
jgi:hypothetical protein